MEKNREEPVRVLHVLGTLNMGGAESRTMDLYRHIDREKLQFDFLIHTTQPQFYEKEVRELGGHIYTLPRFTGKNYPEYRAAAAAFFKEHHEFAAVEGHMTSTASIYLPQAKKYGIRTIAHARSAGTASGIKGAATRLLRSSLASKADVLLACSPEAGRAVFGEKAVERGRVEIVPNAVEVSAYRFNAESRERIRKEFGIRENTFVLGHVGRFDDMKNHRFLVELLDRLVNGEKREMDYCLLMVGTGQLMDQIRQQAAQAGLSDRCVFAGTCAPERTAQIYQAFDAFVFPSLYEGLPGTVIEAQSAGLPCLIADTITKEVCLTPLVSRLSLQEPERWIDALEVLEKRRADNPWEKESSKREVRSAEAAQQLDEAGFDIIGQAERMQAWYLSMR